MRSLAGILCVAALGCGPSSYADFRGQLDTRWCARQIRCGLVGAGEAAKCAPAPPLGNQTLTVDAITSIAQHRLQFHSDNAQECLDAVKSAPCDDKQAAVDLLRHCHAVVSANVSTGGDCLADEECVGGACVGAPCGRCVAFASPSVACVPSGGAPSMTCDPSFSFCDGAVCQRHKQPGDACTQALECAFDYVCAVGKCSDPVRLSEGDVCNPAEQPPCKDGLYCDETGTCAKLKSAGSACTRPHACRDGLVCLNGACAAWLDVGGACAMPGPSVASGCPASQACMNGACAAILGMGMGRAAPGAACVGDDDCADRLWCNAGYCQHRSGLGGACTSDRECVGPLACDGATRQCRPAGACSPSM